MTHIRTDIDYDLVGKQVSVLRLPDSTNTSAMRTIRIPIALIKNGAGPTVLLMAGNHGDEFEGPIALASLIRELRPQDISGRLIILPAANLPAVLAGTRNSPRDGGNMNRLFPGDPDGSITAQIAFYIAHVLAPMCDAWLDLHSGGASLDYIPCVNILVGEDRALVERNMAMARAFGAPLVVVYDELGNGRSSLPTALKQKVPCLNTEMGGGGCLSIKGFQMCRRGIANVLSHLGVTRTPVASPHGPSRLVQQRPSSYVYATADGVFEPYHELGDEVEKGAPAGRIHFLDDPRRPPVELPIAQSGTVCVKRPLARVEAGDCVMLVMSDADPQG
jgi:predicted deacylase